MNFEDPPPNSVNLMLSQDRKHPAVAVNPSNTSWDRKWAFPSRCRKSLANPLLRKTMRKLGKTVRDKNKFRSI